MLIFIILLVASVHFYPSSAINLTYIVKKGANSIYPSCIAEDNVRYLGIGWIYPLPDTKEKLPLITTKYIPTISNTYRCNFSKYNKCNKNWHIINWQKADNSTKTFDLIFDERWEDFPEIFTSKNSKEFEERLEISHTFELAFSVRSNNVEVFICEGWNPYNYPCYHLNISKNDIYLRKYSSTPKEIRNTDRIDDSYKAFSNIISVEEWRTFILKFDSTGTLELLDHSLNRTVISFEDKEPIKPLYFLMRSQTSALWKIHQNYFLYTNVSQTSRLGPTLNLPSKDLCLTLYVSTCQNCAMTFLIVDNGVQTVLEEVAPTQNKWRLIKLKKENVLSEKINIFVKTKLVDEEINSTDNFWAIDDVRICHENEVKVTFLELSSNTTEEDAEMLSCQVIEHAKWRPKKFEYPEIKGMPVINSSSTPDSVILSWDSEYQNPINYFIYYTANDICPSEPHNLKRMKSSGFVMTKNTEIEIMNLVPYTHYNITFTSILHEKEKLFQVNTEETETPMPEELPNGVQIQTQSDKAYVSWQKIDCKSVYGHIIYAIKLTDYAKNTTKIIKNQTDNTIEISGLEPFSNYSIEILTTRNLENIKKEEITGMAFNFTTQPGTPPEISDLEVYATDNDSMSLRYNLPENPRGVPVYLQLTRSNPISSKAKTSVQPIQKCRIWPDKYCVDVVNLIPEQKYRIKISIKNDQSHAFGKESVVEDTTGLKVPGAPTNLTYEIVDCNDLVDYCHLNISWLHPFLQNSNITEFNIILNSTSNNVSENIQEILRINQYYPRYDYQVKYIPYSTHYELYVQSANRKYKSEYANVHVKTADIGDHIDQSPKLVGKTEKSLIFQVPPVDSRLKSYKLTVVVQDYDTNKAINKNLFDNKVSEHFCLRFGNTWISQILEITNNTDNITVGNNSGDNHYLQPNTPYCLTFVVTNFYKDSQHDVVYYEKLHTANETISGKPITQSSSNRHLWGLLVLLLLIPVGFWIYKVIKRRKPKKSNDKKENVYESLPFEDCDENAISNQTYDELLHK